MLTRTSEDTQAIFGKAGKGLWWGIYLLTQLRRSQIEPGWRAWMSHAVIAPPTEDPTLRYQRRSWEDKDAATIPSYTLTRGAYKPYSTYVALTGKRYSIHRWQYG